MLSQQGLPRAENVDLGTLGRALRPAKTWIVAGAGIMTFVGLSTVRPLYTSESRILNENDVSPFTRAATDPGRDQKQALHEQAVQIQVQILPRATWRDVPSLDLANNPEFAQDAGTSLFARGLGGGADRIRPGETQARGREESGAPAPAQWQPSRCRLRDGRTRRDGPLRSPSVWRSL